MFAKGIVRRSEKSGIYTFPFIFSNYMLGTFIKLNTIYAAMLTSISDIKLPGGSTILFTSSRSSTFLKMSIQNSQDIFPCC